MRCDNCKTIAAMMTTDRIDASLPFTLKKERHICNDSDSDISSDNIDDFTSVPLPSLSKNDSVIADEYNNEFLRLTATARFFMCMACVCVCARARAHTH